MADENQNYDYSYNTHEYRFCYDESGLRGENRACLRMAITYDLFPVQSKDKKGNNGSVLRMEGDGIMNKKIWDLYAPIYEKAMKSDRKVYEYMYERIPKVIKDKDVLEIATGPGLLATLLTSLVKTMKVE